MSRRCSRRARRSSASGWSSVPRPLVPRSCRRSSGRSCLVWPGLPTPRRATAGLTSRWAQERRGRPLLLSRTLGGRQRRVPPCRLRRASGPPGPGQSSWARGRSLAPFEVLAWSAGGPAVQLLGCEGGAAQPARCPSGPARLSRAGSAGAGEGRGAVRPCVSLHGCQEEPGRRRSGPRTSGVWVRTGTGERLGTAASRLVTASPRPARKQGTRRCPGPPGPCAADRG